MRGLGALMSSATDEWLTPAGVLGRVRRVGDIELDPCTTPENPVCAARWITREQDGLSADWSHGPRSLDALPGLVFVNPPYSDNDRWAEKVAVEAALGRSIVLLVPARTDTRWFHRAVALADALVLWRGRLRFERPDGSTTSSAPFPSVLMFYNISVPPIRSAFLDAGEVLRGPRWR